MSTVVVTGCSGYIGQSLMHLLEKDDEVEKVVGIDVVEPQTHPAKLEFRKLDIRDAAIAEAFAGADVVIHLAFVLNPMQDDQLMHEINVGGTRNVLSAIEDSGVARLVYPSSIVAYGARSDNDYPLTEESPLRANPDFNYGEHKLEIERLFSEWRPDHPEVKVTIFRPAIVFGPHVQNFISRTLEGPQILAVSGYSPPLQLIHEDDVAAAFHFAVHNELDGVYNLCADGELSRSEVLEISGKKELALPETVLMPAAKIGWKLGLTEVPSGEVSYLMYRWVMSNEKLTEAGFSPSYSNREALAQTIEANRGWVTLGRWRMRQEEFESAVSKYGRIAGVVVLALTALGLRRRMKKRRARKAASAG